MTASLVDMDVRIDGSKLYKELRAERPVYFDNDIQMFVVSRYDDIANVFRQPNLFSSALALFHSYQYEEVVTKILNEEGRGPFKRVLPMTDPPEHTRVRSMVNLAFSMRRISKIQDYIEKLTQELVDAFIDDGKAEIVSQLAIPLPVTVIGDLLCVPRERWADVRRWTNAYTACAGNRLSSQEEAERLGHDLAEMQNFIVNHINSRRTQPGDDVLTDLLNARAGDYQPLDEKEILAIAVAFLGAGHETSTVAITSAIKQLALNPHLIGELRNAPDQDAACRAFCEEVLRVEPPLNALPRVATADTEIGGVAIPAGSRILVIGASGNRDEKIFGADSENFRPGRENANKHLTFGGGVHQCLGNMLARAEMKSVVRAIVNRMDSLRLVNPNMPLSDYHPVIMDLNYRLKKLDVEFTKRA